nr:uncharacterized protein LOC125970514 isoform X2 [Syngnathus scovelli]
MIIRWSAISFVGLALLWCLTWTKVGAWLPPGLEESRPELPHIHPYDPRKTPNRIPSPRPSSPQPSQQGPPSSSGDVRPPNVAAETSYPFLNSERPNVLPWPFFNPPESQNPPPPSEGQPDPPGSGSYVYFRPPNQRTPPISRHSSSVDSSLEKPPGLGLWPGPWLSPLYPVAYNPAVPGFSQLYPPGLQPPRNHRLPVIYYDSPSRFQGPSNPSNPKPVDQLPNYPSFSGPSVIQGSESPDSSSLPPKPDNPPSRELPGLQLPQQSGNPPPDRSPKPSSSLPDYSPMYLMPRSLNDETSEPQSVLPRGFYDRYFPHISQPENPGKEIPVPLQPGVRDPNFENCDVPTVQRIPCGGFGITATSCETISCCFDGRNCYYPKYHIIKPQPPETLVPVNPGVKDPNFENCDVPTVQRIPCGGFGITATSCKTNGCCFDGRNCYYPKYHIIKPQPPETLVPVNPGVRDPNFENCDVPTVQRIPCGGFGITATSCKTNGCCFDGRNCYYPKYHIIKPQPPETLVPVNPGVRDPNFENCDMPTVQRIPCGGFGITATSCKTNGCCFDGRNCYYPKYHTTRPKIITDPLPDPNAKTCDVPRAQRIPCGVSDISPYGCEAISCCYDGRDCYYGKSVTIQCTKDAQFILVVARDATLPNLDIGSISMLGDGPECTQIDSNSAFSIYQFPVSACGTLVAEVAGKIIYENRMTSSYEVGVGPRGAITRDSSFDLFFQCRYSSTSLVESMIAEMLPLRSSPLSVAALGPINVRLKLGNGKCFTQDCNEEDVAYNSFYTEFDYPVNKILRDNVYVEVQLMDRTDPNLVLNLGRCWTTTTANPHSHPQWDIIVNGCPNIDDRYIATPVPIFPGDGVNFPGHHRRFIFKMLTFVDPNSLQPQSEQVYIHCSTSVCNTASGQSCEPRCYRTKRDVSSVSQTKEETRTVVSAGPLIMVKPRTAHRRYGNLLEPSEKIASSRD